MKTLHKKQDLQEEQLEGREGQGVHKELQHEEELLEGREEQEDMEDLMLCREEEVEQRNVLEPSDSKELGV